MFCSKFYTTFYSNEYRFKLGKKSMSKNGQFSNIFCRAFSLRLSTTAALFFVNPELFCLSVCRDGKGDTFVLHCPVSQRWHKLSEIF